MLTNSNTTLVKVKLNNSWTLLIHGLHSNTTLVKVKFFKTVKQELKLQDVFKYNSC